MANSGSTHGQGGTGSPGNVKDKGEQMGASMGAAAGRKAGEAMGKAQETASGMAQRAQDVASNVAQKAQDLASQAADRTDDALSTVGEKMSSLAGTIRESVPREGTMGSAATAVADSLQAGGRYLQEHDLSDMTEELASLVRRHPMQSVLLGFGVGCLVGMTLARR